MNQDKEKIKVEENDEARMKIIIHRDTSYKVSFTKGQRGHLGVGWGGVGWEGPCKSSLNVLVVKARRKHHLVYAAGSWEDSSACVRTLSRSRVKVWPLDSWFQELSTSPCD